MEAKCRVVIAHTLSCTASTLCRSQIQRLGGHMQFLIPVVSAKLPVPTHHFFPDDEHENAGTACVRLQSLRTVTSSAEGHCPRVDAGHRARLVFTKSSAVRRLAPPRVLLAASPACQPATVDPLPLSLLTLRSRGAADAASRSATMFAEDTCRNRAPTRQSKWRPIKPAQCARVFSGITNHFTCLWWSCNMHATRLFLTTPQRLRLW